MIGLFILLTLIFNLSLSVSDYQCIVIEDDIPSPFNANHCLQKIEKLIARRSEFKVEIAWSNEYLLSSLNEMAKDGEFTIESAMHRGIESFVDSALKKGKGAILTTALSHCVWHIIDNLAEWNKWFDATEWSMNLIHCINSNWKEVMLWGTASGIINGGIAASKQIKIKKLKYTPNK